MSSELELKLINIHVEITDNILYHPCEGGRAKVEYLDSMWVDKDVLLVSVFNKGYIDIVKNVYQGLLNKKLDDIWDLNNNERRMMYDKICLNPRYQNIKQSKW